MPHREEAQRLAKGADHRPARRSGVAASGAGRVTFVLDRDLHVLDVVAPTGFHSGVHHWMDLVDTADHQAAYDALSTALVSHRATSCELRFTHLWAGHVLVCTFLRSPLSASSGGFLVHVDAP